MSGGRWRSDFHSHDVDSLREAGAGNVQLRQRFLAEWIVPPTRAPSTLKFLLDFSVKFILLDSPREKVSRTHKVRYKLGFYNELQGEGALDKREALCQK